MKIAKYLTLTFFVITLSYGENINYAYNDMHTLTMPKGKVQVLLSKYLMNDTVDVLNIKESELGDSAKFDAIGDLDAEAIKVRYGILDNLMISASIEKEDISYSSNTLKNENLELFLRYNIYQNKSSILNSGISFDVGYVQNKLDDFYIYDLQQINDLGHKVSGNSNLSIGQITDDSDPLLNKGDYYISKLSDNTKIGLNQQPWVALKDTKDSSYYLRILSGIYFKTSTLDFYVGAKKTKIKNLVTTTDELIKTKGYDLPEVLDRDETMYMAGFNYVLESAKTIYEFGFEYDKFVRDNTNLDYIDYNMIFDMSVTRYINKYVSVNIGSKIMYRQLNGEIPYLYNQYSQISYDHKYGYAHASLIFSY